MNSRNKMLAGLAVLALSGCSDSTKIGIGIDLPHPIEQKSYQENILEGNTGSMETTISPDNNYYINISVKNARSCWVYRQDSAGNMVPLSSLSRDPLKGRVYGASIEQPPLTPGSYLFVLAARKPNGELVKKSAKLKVDGSYEKNIPHTLWSATN